MSKIEALEKRIAELEAEVLRLKAAPPPPAYVHHYHHGLPQFYPQPCVPAWPQYPQITWGTGAYGNSAG